MRPLQRPAALQEPWQCWHCAASATAFGAPAPSEAPPAASGHRAASQRRASIVLEKRPSPSWHEKLHRHLMSR